MSSTSRVLVVIPTFNGRQYVGSTIQSVLNQSFDDWNLVVVDDGSRDDSFDVANEYVSDPRIKVIRTENRGIAKARQAGFEYGIKNQEFICFLDHDDIWYRNALGTMVEGMIGHPHWVMAHGLATSIDSDGNRYSLEISEDTEIPDVHIRGLFRPCLTDLGIDFLPPGSSTSLSSLLACCPVTSIGTSIIRSTVYKQIGGFKKVTNSAEDWQLYLRLGIAGEIGHIPAPILKYRIHSMNISSDFRYLNQGCGIL